jgi:hypothetical protein
MAPLFRATGRQILEIKAVTQLASGLYAWADTDDKQTVEEAGSGIIVAPGLGLTARHVTKSFAKLDPQHEAFTRRASPLDPQYRVIRRRSEFAALIFQGPEDGAEVTWMPEVTWPSHDTDITAIVMDPRSDAAKKRAETFRFVDWQLLPPRVGSVVRIYGWPDQKINVEAENHDVAVELWIQSGIVIEVCPVMKEHGLRAFPGYRIERDNDLPHGFSGGAVIYEGRLAGIFSGPDYVASLWPLALMTYPDASEVEHHFSDHFDHEVIRTTDWDEVKGRVDRRPCEEALRESPLQTRCNKRHAILL